MTASEELTPYPENGGKYGVILPRNHVLER